MVRALKRSDSVTVADRAQPHAAVTFDPPAQDAHQGMRALSAILEALRAILREAH